MRLNIWLRQQNGGEAGEYEKNTWKSNSNPIIICF